MKKILVALLMLTVLACEDEQKQTEALRIEAEKIHDQGLIKLQAGNFEEALNLFDEAIAIDETFEKPHFNKVEVYLNQSDYQKAINEIEIIIDKAPEVAENWVLAGIFEEKKGNKEKAFEYYETSIVKFKERIDRNKNEELTEEFERSEMDDETAILFSYILLEDFDRLDKAVTKFEDKNPDSPIIEYFLNFNKEVYMDNIFPDFELEE